MDQQRIYDRRKSRLVDELAIAKYGMLGLVLMENAGRNLAYELLARAPCRRVVIVVGKGNNGGDGWVIARHLDAAGVDVIVLLTTPPNEFRGDAAVNYAIANLAKIKIIDLSHTPTPEAIATHFAEADWLVDAMLGTGATGEPRGAMRLAIEAINQSSVRTLAVDLPTGIDCDSGGAATAAARADVTCTFVTLKPCCQVAACRSYLGEVSVIDIGVPRALLEEIDAMP